MLCGSKFQYIVPLRATHCHIPTPCLARVRGTCLQSVQLLTGLWADSLPCVCSIFAPEFLHLCKSIVGKSTLNDDLKLLIDYTVSGAVYPETTLWRAVLFPSEQSRALARMAIAIPRKNTRTTYNQRGFPSSSCITETQQSNWRQFQITCHIIFAKQLKSGMEYFFK